MYKVDCLCNNTIMFPQIVSRPEMVDSSGLATAHKPTLCTFGHLKKYQHGVSSTSTEPDNVTGGDRASMSQLGRRIIGYSRPHASDSAEFVTQGDAYDVDAVVTQGRRDTTLSAGDDCMTGDLVVLPDWDEQKQTGGIHPVEEQQVDTTDDPVLMRGMLRRQDTFGDEFYENWEKVITVKSPAASRDTVR